VSYRTIDRMFYFLAALCFTLDVGWAVSLLNLPWAGRCRRASRGAMARLL